MTLQPVSGNQAKYSASSPKEALAKCSHDRPQEASESKSRSGPAETVINQPEITGPSAKSSSPENRNPLLSDGTGFPPLASPTIHALTKLHNGTSTRGLERHTALDTLPQDKAEIKPLLRQATIKALSRPRIPYPVSNAFSYPRSKKPKRLSHGFTRRHPTYGIDSASHIKVASARDPVSQEQAQAASRAIPQALNPKTRLPTSAKDAPAGWQQHATLSDSVLHLDSLSKPVPAWRGGGTKRNELNPRASAVAPSAVAPSAPLTREATRFKIGSFPTHQSKVRCQHKAATGKPNVGNPTSLLKLHKSCNSLPSFKNPPETSPRQTNLRWEHIMTTIQTDLPISGSYTMSTSTIRSPLGELIKAKGGIIELQTLHDCDSIFRPIHPDIIHPDKIRIRVQALGDLWLDGKETLPRLIETRLLVLQHSSASKRAYNDLYVREIFGYQTSNPNDKITSIVRLYEPASQETTVDKYQPLPPNIQAPSCGDFSVSATKVVTRGTLDVTPSILAREPSKNVERFQRSASRPPHSGAGRRVHQNNGTKTSQSAEPAATSVVLAATPNPYTDFIISVQYWLSGEIWEPGLQKKASTWVPRLFNGSPYYAPYLTVVLIDEQEADKDEYRRKLVAASSICLYQQYRLFRRCEENQEKQAQLSDKTGPKPLPEGQDGYLERLNFHFGILMDGLKFEVFAVQPLLSANKWNGFRARQIAAAHLETLDHIKTLLHWVSAIHRWSVTTHRANFETDLSLFPDRVTARQSLLAE
ncbi:hypothetical protein MMC17_007586 [Xylographa soralifera]|nr:hypothetical protein [Xylographa soralifera]